MDGFTQSALLKALGWALFDSLWQMALLWLSYTLLVSAFSKMSANARHGLAVLLIGAGTGSAVLSFVHYLSAGGAPTGDWLNTLLPGAEHPGHTLPEVAGQVIGRLLPYFSLLYLLALVWLIIRYSHHYLHARLLKEEGLSRIGPDLRVFVEQTARRMGIKRTVGVWLSSLVEGPVTLGFLRPVILIPFAMVNDLSLEQAEAILLHELAHIKRFDYLLNLAVTTLQLFFFFNPFARLLIRQIRKEREHCCDDLVIQFRVDPHAYASALLSLAALGQGHPQLALAATGKNDQLLLQRVKRILKQDRVTDRPGSRPMIIFLVTVLAVLITLPHRAGPMAAVNPAPRPSLHNVLSSTVHEEGFPLKEHPPMDRTLVFAEKRQPKKPSVLKRDSLRIDNQDGISPDQDLAADENNMPEMGYSADQASSDQTPIARNMTISRIDPPPAMSKAGQLLTIALTNPKSSATEVRSNIRKAMAANEGALEKTRKLLNSHLQKILRDSSSADQGTGQEFLRQLEEENTQLQRQLLQQQDLQKLLERAAKKLSIVYI
jgi:beta-lactamase regulating signal transducer with metallopeptidase domain